MRSQLIYSAGIQVTNRFLLSTIAMGAVRRLHVNSTRVEDTTNQILSEVGNGNYIQVKMPEIKAAPSIDPSLIPVVVG